MSIAWLYRLLTWEVKKLTYTVSGGSQSLPAVEFMSPSGEVQEGSMCLACKGVSKV
jgi:hypothetical protein